MKPRYLGLRAACYLLFCLALKIIAVKFKGYVGNIN
jgi:hypothetical protein